MSAQLEDLVPGSVIGGVVPAKDVKSVALSWHGGAVLTLTYRDPDGRVVVERGDEGVARIKELTGGLGAHSVIEAVGTQESMMQAIRIFSLIKMDEFDDPENYGDFN